MVRKLLIVLASLMMVLPSSAYALGFGNIKLKSALGEPLNADIDLLSATPQDVAGLTVTLAPRDAFASAGIDRAPVLNQLKFIVKSRANGTYYIHATSSQPIREPYLDFLLELNWSHGRMLREYTVLLDPPNLMRKQPTMVAPATTETPSTIARNGQPTPMPVSPTAPGTSEATPGHEAARTTTSTTKAEAVVPGHGVSTAPATQPAPKQAAPGHEVTPAAVPATALARKKQTQGPQVAGVPVESNRGLMPYIPIKGGETEEPVRSGRYVTHITRKGDKLWNIAENMRPDDVSVYQMMMALLRSNPKAFESHNVNRLKPGYVLRIDNPSLLHQMSNRAAVHKFEMQNQAWEEYRQRMASAATKQPLLTAGQRKTSSAARRAAEPKGRLKLVSPSGKGESAGGGRETAKRKAAADIKELQTARKRLNLALEAAATERRKNADMTDRLKELEKQIKEMQRLITLKDDQLAALQEQLKAQAKAKAKAKSQHSTVAPNGSATPATPAKPSAPSAQKPTQGTTHNGADTGKPIPKPNPPLPGAAVSGKNNTAALHAGQTKPKSLVAHHPTKETAPTADSRSYHLPAWKLWLNKFEKTLSGFTKHFSGFSKHFSGFSKTATRFGKIMMASPLLMAGAAAALFVLLLLMIIVRRRKRGYGFQESILTGRNTDNPSGASGRMEQGSEVSSFLSDFAVSGANAIQTEDNEVDPLTEADVYIAYGRTQQAEELLTEAIHNAPNRKELKLKLLELYQSTQNKERFEEVAEDLYGDIGNDNDPMWAKVVSMGAEVAPDNPLFSGSVQPASAGGGGGLPTDDVMDIGLDTGVFEMGDFGSGGEATATAAPAAAADTGLDFNFDLGGDTATEVATEAAGEASGDDGGLDFNLNFADTETPTEPSDEFQLDIGGDQGGSGGDLDFNLDFDADGGATSTADVGGGLDFDLGGSSGADTGSDDAGGGLDFDFGGSSGTDTDAGNGLDFDFGGLGTDLSEEFPSATDTEVDIGASQADETQVLAFDSGGSDIGGMGDAGDLDEVGTKLDLAKAYIDMGDPEGARSILDEVMQEGNNSQKNEAQELIAQIV